MKSNIMKRWMFYMMGLVILALGVTLTIKGHLLGLGSWDVFHYGLWQTFGLTIGSWSIIVGAVIVIFTAMMTREWPRLGVYVNMLSIGIFIDFFNWVLPNFEGWTQHTIVFSIGLLVMSFGVAFYITPNLGAGPRDSLMLLMVDKFGLKISVARNIMEFSAAVGGYLLGGPVFIGTLVIVFGLGKLIEVWLPLTRRLLVLFLGTEDKNIIKVI